MRFRPGFDVPFLCVEAILIGGHYAFPVLPHELGLAMFWAGIAGLIVWVCARLGLLDNFPFLRRFRTNAAERDTEMSLAVAYVCYRNWNYRFLDAAGSDKTDAVAALKEILQAAADGALPIWGRHRWDGAEIYTLISADYWRRYQIEWFGLLKGVVTTEPSAPGVDPNDRFAGLMTSRERVEQIWPKKRTRFALRLPWEKRTHA